MTAFVSIAQGVFYLATGLWPIGHIDSFLKVTGPKTDLWLVKTVGLLISVIGAVLAMAGFQRQVSPAVSLLGISSAAGLSGVDVVYVAKKRISPVYLLDALVELILIGFWLLARQRQS